MDRWSWPWKRKSLDKSAAEKAIAMPTNDVSRNDKDDYVKPSYVQISVESYSHLRGLQDQVKAYEDQLKTLEKQNNELHEKLSVAHSEITSKEELVKQHAKVAEGAVTGWGLAETESLALKNHLESSMLQKLTAQVRAAHLDGALKDCMRQISNMKEDHERQIQYIVVGKNMQYDKIKHELESKITELGQELERAEAENGALSWSLQERSNMLTKINDEKLQAEVEIEMLKGNIESCDREINSLKYELRFVSKELETRIQEKNISVKSAEAANKQKMEGVKKIAKLEADCRRLRRLMSKKLPGPTALAQMKKEVESYGQDSRLRRPPAKPSSPGMTPTSNVLRVPEFSHDDMQKFQRENEFLTKRQLAMEEETKMLKEALAVSNSELQTSRSMYAEAASKLQSLEARQHLPSRQKPSPPSMTSMSEDGNDSTASCAGSWSSASISKSFLVKDKSKDRSTRTGSVNYSDFMDDFREMEELARQCAYVKQLEPDSSMCNSELQTSRSMYGEAASKIQGLEARQHLPSPQKPSPPSMTSMSEGGNDSTASCAGSWASASISKSFLLKDKSKDRYSRTESPNYSKLMDEFREMEELARLCAYVKQLEPDSSMRNSELQTSSSMYGEAASKLQSLEARQHLPSRQKPSLPSMTSMSEGGKDSTASCAGSRASASISKPFLVKDKCKDRYSRTESPNYSKLMDEFREMEELARLCAYVKQLEPDSSMCNSELQTSRSMYGEAASKLQSLEARQHLPSRQKPSLPSMTSMSEGGDDSTASCAGSWASASISKPFLVKDKSKDRYSRTESPNYSKLMDDFREMEELARLCAYVKQLEPDSSINASDSGSLNPNSQSHTDYDTLHPHSVNCMFEENHFSENPLVIAENEISSPPSKQVLSQELADGISHIGSCVLYMGKEASSFHGIPDDGDALGLKIEQFSTPFNGALCNERFLTDFILSRSDVKAKARALSFNFLGYKGSEAEANSPDCMDKVDLPENKVPQGEKYANGYVNTSDTSFDPKVPQKANFIGGLKTSLFQCSLEEYEQLKGEDRNIERELTEYSEELEATKSQLHGVEQQLSEVKLQLAYCQRANSLVDTQLKCVVDSCIWLEKRAKDLADEVNLLRGKLESLDGGLLLGQTRENSISPRCTRLFRKQGQIPFRPLQRLS